MFSSIPSRSVNTLLNATKRNGARLGACLLRAQVTVSSPLMMLVKGTVVGAKKGVVN